MNFYHHKSFGYPVLKTLSPGTEAPALEAEAEADASDYPSGEFQGGVGWKLIDERPNQRCCFAYNFKTSVRGLTKAVKDGDAAYFLRVQCPDTYFSQVEQVESKGELLIPANNLWDRTEVTAFIVAIKDTTIKSNQIHKDFGIKEFDVKAGMVLAHQSPTTCYIKKYPSHVLDYWEDDDMQKGEFVIVLGEKQEPVYVRAHSTQIESFKRAGARDGEGRAVLFNSVVFVAVMRMFQALSDDGNDSYENTRWAKVLTAEYKKYDGKIEKGMDIVKATQIILKRPLHLLDKKFFHKFQP